MLSLTLTQTSVVVVSDGNNPRLLNPDFLERNKITPKDWTSTQVIVTPPFSLVEYINGIRVQMEENKVHFVATKPADIAWETELPALASSFLDLLPHVRYRAVGLNYVISCDEPKGQAAEDQLMENLLNSGDWRKKWGGMTGVNFEFQFKSNLPHLALKVSAKEVSSGDTKRLQGYLLTTNIHHDFGENDRAERNQYIHRMGSYYSDITEIVKSLPLESKWPS